MSRKILVTGAGGFIAGHLTRKLAAEYGAKNIRAVDVKPLKEWYQVIEDTEKMVLDLQLRQSTEHCMVGVDTVYNLAADMGGMGYIESHKVECMLSVLINTHLLIAASDAGVNQYFYASSACAYAADKQLSVDLRPLRESDAYPAMPEDGYGWEKLFSERMCWHFMEDMELNTRVARLHNVYGPHGTWRGGREKAPAAICRKVIAAKLSGENQIEIWGDGEQTRTFMWIGDCIEGIGRLMASDFSDPINLGSSELVSINQLVDIVEEIADVKLERNYDLTAPQGVRGRSSDNTLIREFLGWEPSTPLSDGMERTYRWIYDQMVK